MKHKPRGPVSVKWRIFGSFALFTGVILVLLWVFQVVFLDAFYKAIKVNEIKTASYEICGNINSASLQDELQRIAIDNQICSIVCDGKGTVSIPKTRCPIVSSIG